MAGTDLQVDARGDLAADFRAQLRSAARVLGTVTAVGVVCGWLVAGIGSRLAMSLLVRLNPEAAGLTSDDGFVMGQVTLSGTLNLVLLVGTGFGVLGAGMYVALRGLMIGPPWFRVLSMSLGAGIVVAAPIVHADGVDFVLLDPVWLAVGLFVLVPTVYVALLTVLAERLLARDDAPGWLWRGGVLVWFVVFPLLPLLALLLAGFAARFGLRRDDAGARLLASPVGPWLARGVLAVVFVLALGNIAGDVRTLT